MTNLAATNPPWLELLNVMEKEWRISEIELGRNPDPHIEMILFQSGRWPDGARSPRVPVHMQAVLERRGVAASSRQ